MSTPVHPRVTVVVPIYNRSARLRPTVDSVLAQTFTAWELLLIDDGSTDDTAEVCRRYQDPRIRYLPQKNQGQAAARNYGLGLAQGEYVAFLDHDDRWTEEKLRLQVQFLDQQPEIGLVYGRVRHIDEEGHDRGPVRGFEKTGHLYTDLLREHNFIYTMSLPLMRTELVRAVGGFDSSTDLSDDLDLFLRMALRSPFGFVEAELLHYNIGNPQQQTRDIFRVYRSEYQCIQRHLESGPPVSREERAAINRSWGAIFSPGFRERGWHALRQSDFTLAWRCYRQALQLRPDLLRDNQMQRDLLALFKRALLSSLRPRRTTVS